MTIIQSASRIFSSLLLIVVLACVANMEGGGNKITVSIDSASWYVNAVDVVCADNGVKLTTIRGIELGIRQYRHRVKLRDCGRVLFRLRQLAKRDYMLSGQATMVHPGDRVCLRVENAINMSYAYNCTNWVEGN